MSKAILKYWFVQCAVCPLTRLLVLRRANKSVVTIHQRALLATRVAAPTGSGDTDCLLASGQARCFRLNQGPCDEIISVYEHPKRTVNKKNSCDWKKKSPRVPGYLKTELSESSPELLIQVKLSHPKETWD